MAFLIGCDMTSHVHEFMDFPALLVHILIAIWIDGLLNLTIGKDGAEKILG